ncbi:Gfo/Idh/MocA family oxidoreductase [Tessaracoccus sp. MC1865]|uniref:Gfo/Idh/MocA family protein n=1 Tax=Tessaracoccus sp. MC1865 TaxID=2760310 RepID=UPI0015FEBCF6|nr:Gfo/Idh/MocA family oxidoreductase [Tessaracoccus sp. MC1865]MBB1484801.1 Gfo/Idh/MocA family oxidoreductase [Tessaracoccus sp. MC1865]QTO38796.1 Gfo/Idh/MocA family oxidoreductase [Tessaracoccus sp. MC1865]
MNQPIRFGIFGAAGITPQALIAPAQANRDVELYAVAARDRGRAESFAAEHHIGHVHDSYEALLADPNVDAVYIPLPNSEHGKWTVAALDAGKHVLVEKPFASNADEAEEVARRAAGSDRVVMEGFHYRYHRLMAETLKLIADGAIGDLAEVEAHFDINLPDRSNIRYNQSLAGGATMDLGCYSLHFVRSVVGEEPEVVSAEARPSDDPRLDEALSAELTFPGGVTGRISSSLLEDEERQTCIITGTKGIIQVEGFVKPQNGNTLTLTNDAGVTTVEVPTQPTSYAAQLAVFVDAVRNGTPVLTGPDDSVAMMRAIDALYRAAGLEPRETTV